MQIAIPVHNERLWFKYYNRLQLEQDLHTFSWDDMAPVEFEDVPLNDEEVQVEEVPDCPPPQCFLKAPGKWHFVDGEWLFVEDAQILEQADAAFLQTTACEHGCTHGMCKKCNALFISESAYRHSHSACEEGKCGDCELRHYRNKQPHIYWDEVIEHDRYCCCKICAHAFVLMRRLQILWAQE